MTLRTKPALQARSLVDYSDLETASASPPPSFATEAVSQSTGTPAQVMFCEIPKLPSFYLLSHRYHRPLLAYVRVSENHDPRNCSIR